MKKMKKLFAVILSLAMVLGMTVTSFASDPTSKKIGVPSNNDTVEVKIKGLTGDPIVTLYKIAEVKYGENGSQGFVKYNWVEGAEIDFKASTSDQLAVIANKLIAEELEGLAHNETGNITGDTYTADVHAGVYVATITGASDGSVYNPILLTATYANREGETVLNGGALDLDVDTENGYLNGVTAVAKKSEPEINKTITGGATTDDIEGNKLPDGTNTATTPGPTTNATASVGDRLEYTITPTMPSYPKEAVNKTLAVSDMPSKGLTFEFDSLNLYIDDPTGAAANKAGKTVNEGIATFTYDDKVIAYARKVIDEKAGTTGFAMTFVYDNLIYGTSGDVHVPIIKYNAVVNDAAVVGTDGNTNTTNLYYTNQPNTATDWTPESGELPDGEDVETKTDKETFYTYQLAFHKVGDANDEDGKGLANAVFGIYSDPSCAVDKLVDKVTTDEHGYAESSKVGAGKYYIKELVAPEGYSLNTDVYEIQATWKTATATITETTRTERTYTRNQEEAKSEEVVGYLDKDGNFYNLKTPESVRNELHLDDAYLKSETTITTKENTVLDQKTNATSGIAAILKNYTKEENATDITNTTLTSLPSTGGIGTTIFTIGGCVIMIAAAALFFASRKKSQK